MYPVLLKLGPLPVHSYGLMLALGFLAGLFLARRDAPKYGLDPDKIADAAFWVLLLAIAGTRVAFIMMFPEDFSWRDPLGWFAIWKGGLVFQGAIPPAIVFIYYWTRKHNMPFWTVADLAVPCLALGHAIGRLGCFLNGCCYGARTEVPWGISFPRVPFDTTKSYTGSPAFMDHVHRFGLDPAVDQWSYHVHPTQLYSSVGLLFLCILLITLRKYCRPFHGSTACYYFIFYGIGRFGIEMLRDDGNPVHLFGLTDQQNMALAASVAGIILWIVLSGMKKRHVRLKKQTATSSDK